MTVSDGEVLRVSARQEMTNGQDHVNVFHYKADFIADQADQDVLDTISEELDTAYSTLNSWIRITQRPVDMKFDIVEFVDEAIRIVRNVALIVWPDTLYDPTPDTDVLPPGVAALVKFLTPVGKVYGRKFIGGIIEDAQGGGTLASGIITALANFAGAIMSGPAIDGSNGFIPGVMSHRQQAFVEFTEADVSDNVAYQRRRRRGTGS